MKKMLFFVAGLATVALASCVSEELVESNKGNAIEFRAATSRATETKDGDLTQFNASALWNSNVYFDAITFTKGADNFFKSADNEVFYWPGSGDLQFFAWAPLTVPGVSITTTAQKINDFVPNTDIAQQIDLLASYATGNKVANEGNGVHLDFKHALSQIQIMAKADNANYRFTVTGVRIGRIGAKATMTFNNTNTVSWSDPLAVVDNTAIYTSDYTNVEGATPNILSATAVDIMGPNGNAMIIPQDLTNHAWNHAEIKKKEVDNGGTYLAVRVKVERIGKNGAADVTVYPFVDGTDPTKVSYWAAIPIKTNWEPGKKYVYTLDFSRGAGYVDPTDPVDPGTPILNEISFTCTVLTWGTDVPVDGEGNMTTE